MQNNALELETSGDVEGATHEVKYQSSVDAANTMKEVLEKDLSFLMHV